MKCTVADKHTNSRCYCTRELGHDGPCATVPRARPFRYRAPSGKTYARLAVEGVLFVGTELYWMLLRFLTKARWPKDPK